MPVFAPTPVAAQEKATEPLASIALSVRQIAASYEAGRFAVEKKKNCSAFFPLGTMADYEISLWDGQQFHGIDHDFRGK